MLLPEKRKPVAVIIGASSCIAKALCSRLQTDYIVIGISRSHIRCGDAPYHQVLNCDYDEDSIYKVAGHFEKVGVRISLLISCVGLLHAGQAGNTSIDAVKLPEKSLSQLSFRGMEESFRVNAIIPALFLSCLSGLFVKNKPVRLVFLSAMVGSITENRLGGWYSYRSSKAALNMMVKTTSIELKRKHPDICIVAMHPGTTRSALSRPFTSNTPEDRLYQPEETAARLINVIDTLGSGDNGKLKHWDGSDLPW